MTTGTLTINLDAVVANWRALDAKSRAETAAVVKADAYGLGAAHVARRLAEAGARTFFVAVAQEGAQIRRAVGSDARICVFSGHMDGDTRLLAEHRLTPMLNSVEQLTRHLETLPGHRFGIQLDTGMNRLGMEPAEWAAVRDIALAQKPVLLMSHLACADERDHQQNKDQLQAFNAMTADTGVARSLSATGGILLGQPFHFDMVRPGVGLYGGLPFADAQPVIRLELPVVQVRHVEKGESVGYGAAWVARRDTTLATLSAGYADGLIRALSNGCLLWHGDTACPLAGRVSMDLLTVDISALDEVPEYLSLIDAHQSIDDLADAAGTIGYEILTSLGARYARRYVGA